MTVASDIMRMHAVFAGIGNGVCTLEGELAVTKICKTMAVRYMSTPNLIEYLFADGSAINWTPVGLTIQQPPELQS